MDKRPKRAVSSAIVYLESDSGEERDEITTKKTSKSSHSRSITNSKKTKAINFDEDDSEVDNSNECDNDSDNDNDNGDNSSNASSDDKSEDDEDRNKKSRSKKGKSSSSKLQNQTPENTKRTSNHLKKELSSKESKVSKSSVKKSLVKPVDNTKKVISSKSKSSKKSKVSRLFELDEDDDEDYEENYTNKSSKNTPFVSSRNTTSLTRSKSTKKSSKIDYTDDLTNLSPSVILQEIRSIRDEMRARETMKNISAYELMEGIREVRDLPSNQVVQRIEDLIVDIVSQIMSNNQFELVIPNRNASNQKYIEEIDRIVLGDKISKRQFLNTSHVRKTAITTRVIQLIHEVVQKGIHITKRDMFYTDVKLFKEQGESDGVLDDIACMLGCTRTSLHIVASDKGLVVGRIQYQEAGDEIDCTKMGIGGKAIPPYIDKITNIRSDADFVILVEKEAAYMRLAEDRFYQKYPCIIVTGKGQPDVATRLFLKKIKDELKIPVLALVDSDPYGLKILSVYCSGSKQMSYDSGHLTTSEIKWLGIRPSDLDKFHLPEQCRLPMTENDKKMGEELLKEPFIQKNPLWVAELTHMLKTGVKAEIQALSSFGFQYITEVYLPMKLRDGDWI